MIEYGRRMVLSVVIIISLASLLLLPYGQNDNSSFTSRPSSPPSTASMTRTMFVVDAWKVCDDRDGDGFDDDGDGDGEEAHYIESISSNSRSSSINSSISSSSARGICPDHATCCPTATATATAATTSTTTKTVVEWGCLSSKAHDPPDGSGGTCCDLQTGCSYGYDCAVVETTSTPSIASSSSLSSSSSSLLLKHTNKSNGDGEEEDDYDVNHYQQYNFHDLHGLVCQQNDKIDPDVTPVSAKQTPRPRLCHIPNPDTVQVLQKFPIYHRTENRKHKYNPQPKAFHATYYSSIGSIVQEKEGEEKKQDDGDGDDDSVFETVIVVIHGSARNADDYLCMGLSLQPSVNHFDTSNSNNDNDTSINTGLGRGRVLVVAPKFPSVNDDDVYPEDPTVLRWDELPPNGDKSKTHTWRWGADAVNTTTTTTTTTAFTSSYSESSSARVDRSSGISSYDVIDQLIEYIVETYTSVKRIAVIGHSAGGQVVQRWSLLSSSHVWDWATNTTTSATTTKPSIVAIPANPRSYCYLDGRRMIPAPEKYLTNDGREDRNNGMNFTAETKWKFDFPDPADVSECPTYNHWQWGLDDRTSDNELPCPYKDHALKVTGGSTEQMARRYAGRKVVYLTGSEDVEYLDDHCETMSFQGLNRHERAYRFWESLQHYFHEVVDHSDDTSILKHEIHSVEGSPHDHFLMFQSAISLNTIFGTPSPGGENYVDGSGVKEGKTTAVV